jgi:hypothetical protein
VKRNLRRRRDVGRSDPSTQELAVNNIIWIVGAIVIILAILSFFGLR